MPSDEYLMVLEERKRSGTKFSATELKPLYMIAGQEYGQGPYDGPRPMYDANPRIRKLLESRDKKLDLSIILRCKPEEISLTAAEADQEGIKYHYGNLKITGDNLERKHLPEHIIGSLIMNEVTTLQGGKLPKYVSGHLIADKVEEALGVVMTPKIN